MSQQNLLPVKEYKAKYSVKKKQKKHEENLQLAVCNYIRTKYPHVIFNCDIASGMRMPIYVAARCKKMRSGRGYPDLFIAHPKKQYHGYPIPVGDDDLEEHQPTIYHGLFIELKKEGLRLQNGEFPKTDHIKEQQAVLDRLKDVGYIAIMVSGYDEAISVIDEYLK